MPIDIVLKPKTKPMHPGAHPSLVPLRVVSFHDMKPTGFEGDKQVEVTHYAYYDCDIDDILFTIYDGGATCIVNATKKRVMNRRRADQVGCVRAYDVQQIVLTNDDTPAPVV